jgi:hypothetical protein
VYKAIIKGALERNILILMSEPVDIQIAKRSEMFVPDEFRLLVYVGSKFDCL